MSKRKYDILMLLAGENPKLRPRSNMAIELFRQGRVGNILISGSAGAFTPEKPTPEQGEHTEIADYLNTNKIPASKIFSDWRPLDTLGNFAFPYSEPLDGNPDLNEEGLVLHLTEIGHQNRARDCAKKVIPHESYDFSIDPDGVLYFRFAEGDYNPSIRTPTGIIIAAYHKALMNATRHIRSPSPQRARKFLEERHPVYQDDWFDLSTRERQLKVIGTIVNWGGF